MQTGYPFTKEQWKELERQAAASSPLPIPTRLLPPIATSSPARVDLDPARCRRSDGKKWRCSKRVVSPNQKYCERHVNRGRPRSQASIASANHKTPRHRQPYSFPSPSFYPRLQTKNMEWIVRVRPEKDEEQTYLNLGTENPSPLFLNFDSNPNPSYSEPLQTKTKVNDLMNLGVGNSWVSPLAEVLRSAVGFGDGSDYSPADYP